MEKNGDACKCEVNGCNLIEASVTFKNGSVHKGLIGKICRNLRKTLPQDKPADDFIMEFGTHKSKTLAQIWQDSPGYIQWGALHLDGTVQRRMIRFLGDHETKKDAIKALGSLKFDSALVNQVEDIMKT